MIHLKPLVSYTRGIEMRKKQDNNWKQITIMWFFFILILINFIHAIIKYNN